MVYCWPDVVGVGETAPTPVNVAAVPESANGPGRHREDATGESVDLDGGLEVPTPTR